MHKLSVVLTALLFVTMVEGLLSETIGCSKDIIAYYKFDYSYRDVCYGNNAIDEESAGFTRYAVTAGKAAYFGKELVRVPSLNGYTWGSQFSVSLWFKNRDRSVYRYALINNGYNGSWEIGLIRNKSDSQFKYHISARIMMANSSGSWSDIGITYYEHWHHIVMTYDGHTVNFYLDKHLVRNDSKCCHGDVMTTHTDVLIGRARDKDGKIFFQGYIDEVVLLRKALTAGQVTLLYQLPSVDDETNFLSSLLSSSTFPSSTLSKSSSRSLPSLSSLVLFIFLVFGQLVS